MVDTNKDGYVLSGFSVDPIMNTDEEIDQAELADKMDIKDSFVSYIGEDNYKHIYEMYYSKLSSLTADERRSIAVRILDVIEDKYDYRPTKKYELTDRNVYYIFDFIAFLEFNYIDFFTDLWFNILNEPVKLYKINITRFIFLNQEQIIKVIDELIPTLNEPQITKDFLNDLPRERLLSFITEQTIKRQSEIVTQMVENYFTEGEENE